MSRLTLLIVAMFVVGCVLAPTVNAAKPPTVSSVDTLVVDYGRSTADAMLAGHFRNVDPRYDNNVFRNNPHNGKVLAYVVLVEFGREISSEEAAWELLQLQLRPADFPTLAAFAEKRTEMPDGNYPIVALDEYLRDPSDGRWYAPNIDRINGPRKLCLTWRARTWAEYTVFLAIWNPDLPELKR